MRAFFLFLFFFGFSVALTGHNADSLHAERCVKNFSRLKAMGSAHYAAAFASLDSAFALLQKADALDRWLYLQSMRGMSWAELYNQPFEALESMEQRAKNGMWRAPRSPEEHLEHCYFYLDQAYIAKQYVEDFVRVKSALEKAYDIFHTSMGAKHNGIAKFLYFQLGNTYVRFRDFKSAERVFEEGLQYSLVHDAPEVAKYSDYGGYFVTRKNYPAAQKMFREGMLRKGVPEEDRIFTRLGLVECLVQMNALDEALKINREVEQMLAKTNPEKMPKLPEFAYNVQENYGIYYHKRGDLPRALQHYRRALQIAEPYPRATKRQKAFYKLGIGNILADMGKPDEALIFYHDALCTLLPKLASATKSHPDPAWLSAENVLLQALEGKARALLAMGLREDALVCYERIPLVEAKLRATHAYESSSLMALDESRKRFQSAVDLAWALFSDDGGRMEYAQRAFRLTELSRGMLLLQSLVQARQYLPDALLAQDDALRTRMAWLEHELAAEREKGAAADTRQLKQWEEQLFDLKLQRQRLLQDYPNYNNPDSVFLQVLGAGDLSRLLRPGQAMVNYFFTENTAYVFSVGPDGTFRWRNVVLAPSFREQTKQFAAFLWQEKNEGRAAFLQFGRQLDSLLLAPERKQWANTSSMVVVPDDVLVLVPFEVLLTAPAQGGNWRDLPWLLMDYNIGYAYSATLLGVQQGIGAEHRHADEKPPHIFGGFAPVYTSAGAYRLSNTFPMVKNVQKALGGEAWLDKEANEERFKQTAGQYRTLLLAMHGISDNEQPELSRLLFGDPGADSAVNNNILYAPELEIMRLRADLVVLSACHSGAGKLEHGEGVYSLARAFAAARVPASVMSLWLLHEATAPPLVEAFFQYLQAGKNKDEALRLAKLDFLKNDENFETTHPFFWAGLTAAGDMCALELATPFYKKWQFWSALLLLGAAGFFIRKKYSARRTVYS
ncbi:MAG: CHAT domain-containing tetratricopeptide repeat protein [Saprospiraceae bacterium]|nr:CHAT domain-containing tetratricopeptide repeat protein [Saprospiraceae bacterium]